MRLSRWMMLIGGLVVLGSLQVAQRNAVILKSYAIADRYQSVQTKQTELAWLGARVSGESSPTSLAKVAQERHYKFVAWATLPLQRSQSAPQGSFDDLALHDSTESQPELKQVATVETSEAEPDPVQASE